MEWGGGRVVSFGNGSGVASEGLVVSVAMPGCLATVQFRGFRSDIGV